MDDEPRRTGKQMERLGVEDNLEEQAGRDGAAGAECWRRWRSP